MCMVRPLLRLSLYLFNIDLLCDVGSGYILHPGLNYLSHSCDENRYFHYLTSGYQRLAVALAVEECNIRLWGEVAKDCLVCSPH